jgi:hypothetical protein
MRLIHQGKPVRDFQTLWREAERRAKLAQLLSPQQPKR